LKDNYVHLVHTFRYLDLKCQINVLGIDDSSQGSTDTGGVKSMYWVLTSVPRAQQTQGVVVVVIVR